jgi:hypothetical protein
MKTYRDLQGWQKSMTLVTEIYKISKGFPMDEAYGITSQRNNFSNETLCDFNSQQHGGKLWSKLYSGRHRGPKRNENV